MKKAFLLAFSNIKKTKGQVVSLLLLIMLAMMLFIVGIVTYKDNTDNFFRRAKELNAPDGILAVEVGAYTDKIFSDLNNSEYVAKTEKTYANVVNFSSFDFSDGTLVLKLVVLDMDSNTEFNNTDIVKEASKKYSNGIYVPQVFESAGGYELGDEFVLTTGSYTNTYTIQGFFDNLYFGCQNVGCFGVMFDSEGYKAFSESTEHTYDSTMIYIKTTDRDKASTVVNKTFSDNIVTDGTLSTLSMNILGCKQGRTFMSAIIAMMIVSISVIILVVCLLIIRFRIINIISDNVKSIGTLKAMGYSNNNIISSYIMQFLIISLLGIVLSFACVAAVMPSIVKVLGAQSGMTWEPHFSAPIIGTLVLIMLTIVTLTVLITAKRVNKLHPIVALRGGIETHSFKKNALPFDKTPGNKNVIFGLKGTANNLRQNIMICGIIIPITFIGIFTYVLYYNMAVDSTAFVNCISGETPSVQIILNENKDDSFIETLRNDSRIEKAEYRGSMAINIDDNDFWVYISRDFSVFDCDICYSGRHPQHSNEIALGGLGAQQLGIELGDEIEVICGGSTKTFVVTGFVQISNNMGFDGEVTSEGMKELYPKYEDIGIYVYTKDGVDISEVCDEYKANYKDEIIEIANIQKMLDAELGSYIDIAKLISVIILLISATIISLILFLVIKTFISKSAVSFGIQKAMGYTTAQIILQIAVSFVPLSIIGISIGTILGVFLTNPAFATCMRGIGIMRMNLEVPITAILVLSAILLVYIFIMAVLVSIKIRKISPISLIRE